MEDGLVRYRGRSNAIPRYVLILVVMEDGLVHQLKLWLLKKMVSLNPCCDGRWSRTQFINLITVERFPES